MAAPRSNITLVRKVLDFSTELTDVDVYLGLARDLIDDVCGGVPMTESRLQQIETYLAAHFIAIYEVQAESEGAGPVSTKYRGKTDMGLAATLQGQQAMTLDLSGGLARRNNVATGKEPSGPKQASVAWVGT